MKRIDRVAFFFISFKKKVDIENMQITIGWR